MRIASFHDVVRNPNDRSRPRGRREAPAGTQESPGQGNGDLRETERTGGRPHSAEQENTKLLVEHRKTEEIRGLFVMEWVMNSRV
jgi:hypothetical protein